MLSGDFFDVRSGHVSRRRREAIVSLTGTGWPSHAQKTHPQHLQYAKNALYAYAPCQGSRGTDYIDECVEKYYNGNWADALEDFVSDVDNVWCPKWIRRNYEVQNKMDVLDADAKNAPKDAADVACKLCTTCDNLAQTRTTKRFPHSEKFETALRFEDGEPNISEDEERPETYESRQWKKENREAWQLHSGLGPNLQAESTSNVQESLPKVVNPQDHKWDTFHEYFKDCAPVFLGKNP